MSIFYDNHKIFEVRMRAIEAQRGTVNKLDAERVQRKREMVDKFRAIGRAQMPDVIDAEFREVTDAPPQVSLDKEE